MRRLSLLFLLLSLPFLAGAGEPGRNLLTSKYEAPGVAASFVAGADWMPFPAYTDRDGWAALFGDAAEIYIRRGEQALEHPWTHIPASAYLAYEREGDRKAMERIESGNRGAMISLLLAELAEGKGRFTGHLADGAWFMTEQTSWVLSAHQPRQQTKRSLPDAREQLIDLSSGRSGALISLVYYFFHGEFDKIDPSISAAVERAVKRNILDSYLDGDERDANWWRGFSEKVKLLNNWTPWCVSDVTLAFLLMEKDQARLDQALRQSMESVDAWLGYIAPDGACEEGPNYWDASAGKLYDLLQILYDASGGRFDLFGEERFRRMGTFLSRSFIGDKWVVNFADGSARLSSPAVLSWIYGHQLHCPEMEHFALYNMVSRKTGRFEKPASGFGEAYRALESIRFRPRIAAAVDSLNLQLVYNIQEKVLQGLRKDVPAPTWYPETEICFLRGAGDWFLGAKGGHNEESHNHNDIGTCILFAGNRPVLVDAGVGTYTRATFGKERYAIWSMQGQWHNLPMPNGEQQVKGRDYHAKNCFCDASRGVFSLDLSEAYPEEAGVASLKRSYRLAVKGRPALEITDTYALRERKAADEAHFLVQGAVVLPGETHAERTVAPGTLLIVPEKGAAICLRFPKGMTASVEEKQLDDKRLSDVWGPSLRRITLRGRDNAPRKGIYTFVLEEDQ